MARFWPRSFLDPQSEKWRKEVESAIDSNSSAVGAISDSLTTLSSADAALRTGLAGIPRVQRGFVPIVGNSSTRISTTITFDREFSAPPIVIPGVAGFSTSPTGPTGNDDTGVDAWGNVAAYSVTTTGFTVSLQRSTGTFNSSNYYFVTWIAYPA